MRKGTIYYDESSRGYHHNDGRTPYTRGRWVGEKTIQGRRVRMRSKDYNKVVAWLKENQVSNNDLIPLEGYKYAVNVRYEYVVGIHGKRLKPDAGGKYRIFDSGKSFKTTINRLIYAALHHIDVRVIPKDIQVIKTDNGQYTLITKQQSARRSTRKRQQNQQDIHKLILCKLSHELELLKDFYSTGNSKNVVRYAMSQTDKTIYYLMHGKHLYSRQRASDIAAMAIEQFCDSITSARPSHYTSISKNIKHLCLKIIRNAGKTFEYNDSYGQYLR